MLKPRVPSPLMSCTSVGSLLQMLYFVSCSRDLDLLRLSDAEADSEALASDCSDFAFQRRSIVDILSSDDIFLRRAHTIRTFCGRSRSAAATSARDSPQRWQSFTWAQQHTPFKSHFPGKLGLAGCPLIFPPLVPHLYILLGYIETFHILLNNIQSRFPWAFLPLSNSICLRGCTTFDPISKNHLYVQQDQTTWVYFAQSQNSLVLIPTAIWAMPESFSREQQ